MMICKIISSASKKGSIIFTIKTSRYEYDVVVPQHRKEEFELAQNINENSVIKVIGDKQASGIIFCERIKKLSKLSFDEKQMKLLD